MKRQQRGRLSRKGEPAAEDLARVRALLRECSKRVEQYSRSCVGVCDGKTNCCHFRLTGEIPYVTMGEAWVAWKGWKATGRVKVELPEDGSCPFLNPSTNLCLIYESRPVACRTHFCSLAGGVIPRNAMIDIIRELEDIDRRCGGDGGVRLPDIEKRLARKR